MQKHLLISFKLSEHFMKKWKVCTVNPWKHLANDPMYTRVFPGLQDEILRHVRNHNFLRFSAGQDTCSLKGGWGLGMLTLGNSRKTGFMQSPQFVMNLISVIAECGIVGRGGHLLMQRGVDVLTEN